MEHVLIVLIIFGSIPSFILGLIHLRNRNRERMAILEKGVDPALFKDQFRSPRDFTLKAGILLIGIALGVLTGSIMAHTMVNFPEEVSYFFAIFLFGGISLILSYFVDRQMQKKDKL